MSVAILEIQAPASDTLELIPDSASLPPAPPVHAHAPSVRHASLQVDGMMTVPAASDDLSPKDANSDKLTSETSRQTHRKGKGPAPIDTASLRRSTRSNKYDGFCINLNQDARPTKSKVKPQVLPSAVACEANSEEQDSVMQESAIPPPTTITTMQNIGTQLCAIPAKELSIEALTKEEDGPASSS